MYRRIGVLIIVSLLVGLLAVLGTNLWRELRNLSTAGTDSLLWTTQQIETEFANFAVALSDAVASETPDEDNVRLRADIALSRLLIVEQGAALDLFSQDAAPIWDQVIAYQNAIIDILDADPELSRDDILAMRDLTRDVRPQMRSLVLSGLETGVQRTEARRLAFAGHLAFTGAIAIAVILGLSVVLMALDRLLALTARRGAELLVSTARLHATVEASLDAIVTSNEDGVVVEFNSAAERIFGWSRDEILGQKMEHTIIPQEHRAAHGARMKRYLETKVPRMVDAGRVELSAVRKSGEEFPIELNITTVESADGQLFITYLRDISQRKIDDEKLIDARDRAETMDRAKSQFLAVMSHEMRTPLNGILGVLDLLRHTDLTQQQDRYARVASASGEILLEQVNEALDITRIEMGAMKLSPHRFEMRDIVKVFIEVLTPLAQEKNLFLQVEFSPGMDRAFDGDGGRIGQILTNLIGNAIKFTDTGGIKVFVDGIHSADHTIATITVTDTGQGIPAEHLEDIFEDFVALAHSEGRQVRGDGLGLSISRKVARLMGGDLTVQSEVGTGSTFRLRVPLNRAQPGAVPPGTERAGDTDLSAARTAMAVLIVEDNAVNRSVLRDMLERLGHNVSEATNGLQGVRAAQEKTFDLIFMDVSMPVMGGIEAVGRIRAEEGPNQRTRIYGLTAHGSEDYRDNALAVGMDAFFTKPIRLTALQKVLAEPSVVSPHTADVSIDTEVIDELIAALGPEKAHTAATAFFAEAEAAATELSDPTADAAAVLHKLRGGAALLGLGGLVATIDATAPDGVDAEAVSALREAAAASQDRLWRHLPVHAPKG
ncbi:ATP-binding protein [Gymnodinialimonas sp. 57CJ19]|uniref:hybrid sensor histidine kinase/response regulator n=1 Tax=Gymnodinialimonas sp. 57CJ19 TaxID=3138498 RepID=UPI0031344C77